MNKPISGELRHEFEQMFAALATGNPHIALKDREQCEKALDLVLDIVRGTLSRGAPTYIEADDLIQECLMRLPDVIRDYRGKRGAALKTYLKTAIRRDVMDAIQRERREPIHYAAGDNILPNGETIEDGAPVPWEEADFSMFKQSALEQRELDQRSTAVFDAMHMLTNDQLDAVILCHVSGLTQDAAARQLGITREAVASRLRKASAALKKNIKIFSSRYQSPVPSSLSR